MMKTTIVLDSAATSVNADVVHNDSRSAVEPCNHDGLPAGIALERFEPGRIDVGPQQGFVPAVERLAKRIERLIRGEGRAKHSDGEAAE